MERTTGKFFLDDIVEMSSRRSFLKRSISLAGEVALTAGMLPILTAHSAFASGREPELCSRSLRPVKPGSYGVLSACANQYGQKILALPEGFTYVTFSRIGDVMTDGEITPGNPDGMGAFPGPNGTVRLIRNHELKNVPSDRTLAVEGAVSTRYDISGVAGTITVDFNPESLIDAQANSPVVRDFVSLNGTLANCAGGFSYRDMGWFSCEETTEGPSSGWQEKHGYVFLVPASLNAAVKARPIISMGRFSHEAAVADLSTGIVYQTEDAGAGVGSGFYRFLPQDPVNLHAGGILQMLRVVGRPRSDLCAGQTVGASLNVDWVTISNPDPDLEANASTVFEQGYAQDGAMFNRLEGIFIGSQGSVYFASTSGGDVKNGDINPDGCAEGYGQIWQYLPGLDGDRLVLIFESTGSSVMDSPDNICITPRGGILLCEDDASSKDRDTHELAPGIVNVNRLIGLNADGAPFDFAVNRLNSTELTGCCFSPDGEILFVNIYGTGTMASGMTCAITGPWGNGPL